MTKTNSRPAQKKRHGLHHRQSKHYQHVYLPYLPAILLVVASIVLNGLRLPGGYGVLAYATEMSSSSLLSHTNKQRVANGKTSLTLNSKLNNAAQAKANDMVARNYWSHNTPDGKEPWVFFQQAGYAYSKAGENLAYGFTTSADTISGWMNSATHKANMLDSGFTEVGFGFTNSSNYQGGQETVVVAEYGHPQTLAATASTPPAASQPAATPKPAAKAPAPAVAAKPSAPTSATTQPTTPAPIEQSVTPVVAATPVNSDTAVATTLPQKQVTRLDALTKGRAPWALYTLGLMSGAAVVGLFINHGLRFRKFLRYGEQFVLHHPVLDTTLISFLIFAVTLSQKIGVIL